MLDTRPVQLLNFPAEWTPCAQRGAALSQNRLTIIRLLECYRDVVGVQSAEAGGGQGNEDRLLLTSTAYRESSFPELERVLRLMRTEAQSLHWHVSERYLRSRRQPRQVYRVGDRWRIATNETIVGEDPKQKRRGTHKGQVAETRIVETWDPKVRLQKVERGVTWIERHFRGRPRLAKELGEAA